MFFYQNPLKWVKNLEISASSAFNPEQDGFGLNVSAVSDLSTIVVTENANVDVEDPGAVYVFAKQGESYQLLQKLRASGMNIVETHNFGTNYGVNTRMISEDASVIVAPGIDFMGRGAVAIFRSGSAGYAQEQILIDEDGNLEGFGAFGYTVGLSADGTRLAVGAVGNDDNGTDSGKVYIYRDIGGSFQKVQEFAEEPAFGFSSTYFAVSGLSFYDSANRLIASHWNALSGSINKGAVYIYDSGSSGYQLVDTIADPDPNVFQLGGAFDYNPTTKTISTQAYLSSQGQYVIKLFKSGSNGYQETQTLLPPTESGLMSYRTSKFSPDGSKLYVLEQGPGDGAENDIHVFVSSSNGYQFVEEIPLSGGGVEGYYAFILNQTEDTMILGDYMDGTLGTNAGAVYVYESGSNGWAQSQKILPEDDWSPAEDHFGLKVMVPKNEDYIYILQGNQYGTGPAVNASDTVGGSLYVYKKTDNGYEQVQRIVNPAMSKHPHGTFGALVSPDGTRIFGSDYLKDYDQDYETLSYHGVVYVYESGSSGYRLVQEIQPPSPSLYGFFGASGFNSSGTKLFAYDGNTNICYLYESGSSGYQVVQEITASDSTPQWDSFGGRVVLSEDETIALIAAGSDENSDNSGPGQGSLYIFQSGSSGYTQVQELPNMAPVTHPSNWHTAYGNNLILSEDNQEIIVSADTQVYESTNSYFQRTGTVIIFHSGSNGYQEVQRIEAPSSDEGDSFYFGRSISLSGSYLAISAPHGGRTGYHDRGEVFIYEKINGVYEQKYTFKQEEGRNTEVTFNGFGQSIALLSNNELLVASPYDDKNGTESGVVYRYKLTRDY
jgi:hypothetical protein